MTSLVNTSPGRYSICTFAGCGKRIVLGNSRCGLHGRSGGATARWRGVREAAYRRDGYACVRCGDRGDLTGHLAPVLGGRHELATSDDVTTLCRSCHGVVDAPRASGLSAGRVNLA